MLPSLWAHICPWTVTIIILCGAYMASINILLTSIFKIKPAYPLVTFSVKKMDTERKCKVVLCSRANPTHLFTTKSIFSDFSFSIFMRTLLQWYEFIQFCS